MNLISVEQVTDERGDYRVDKTLANTLKAIFGVDVPTGWNIRHQGVEFRSLRSIYSSYHGHKLLGIQLQAANDYKRVYRKVMVKNDQIDADAVRAKFAELKTIAAQTAISRKQSQDTHTLSRELLDRVAQSLGIKSSGYGLYYVQGISDKSPTEITIEGKVDGSQLLALERIFGKANLPKLAVKLSVSEADAVAVYSILYPEEVSK